MQSTFQLERNPWLSCFLVCIRFRLGKVADALSEVPATSIVIEGHTDATGSAAANAKLSQARAESVLEYLVSSGALSSDRASAIGRGFEEPVASGKTKEGRAMNRRIDVVIGGTTTRPFAE